MSSSYHILHEERSMGIQTFEMHYLGNNLLIFNHHDTFLLNPVEKDPVEDYQLRYCLVMID